MMKQPGDNQEFQNNGNPQGGQDQKMYSEDEYKNAQSFGTKANQALIEMSKKLVMKDPKELLGLDSHIQLKVIKDVYGYDDIEELRVMKPDLFIDNQQEDDDLDNDKNELVEIKKRLALQELRNSKKEEEDDVNKFISQNQKLLDMTPNLKDKILDELKYISNTLSRDDRIKKAIKLVSLGTDASLEAYLSLQGKTFVKTNTNESNDSDLLAKQNQLRNAFGLRTK